MVVADQNADRGARRHRLRRCGDESSHVADSGTGGPVANVPTSTVHLGHCTGHGSVRRYHRDGERFVVAASKGGAPKHPAWYHDLVTHREAEIEVAAGDGTERFRVRVRPVSTGPERDRLYEAHAALMPGFREYTKKTTRVIPVVVLERIEP